jgi:hypothetical protein
VEGIGRGQKRGWSVVCESVRKSKGAVTGGRSADFFFFENPRTPCGHASPGSIVELNKKKLLDYYECGNNWHWSSWKSTSWSAGKLSDFASFVA